jgi:hypothetical protein
MARLVACVRRPGRWRALRRVPEGLASYVRAWQQAVRTPLKTGQRGHPRRLPWPDVRIGPGIPPTAQQRGVAVTRRRLQGSPTRLEALLPSGQGRNTVSSARLHAPLRQRLGCLVRRRRCLARQTATLQAGMSLMGSVSTFCTPHKSW